MSFSDHCNPHVGLNIIYRGFDDTSDLPLLQHLLEMSDAADGKTSLSIEYLTKFCQSTERFTPSRDLQIAYLENSDGKLLPIGFSKVSWYSGFDNAKLLYQLSFLLKEYRAQGIWPIIVRHNELHLRTIAASLENSKTMLLQAWSTDTEKDWMATLKNENYEIVREFNNMIHPMDSIPDIPLPVGFEIRPVEKSHFRPIWEAQREMNAGLFENIAEDWTEDTFPAWVENAKITSSCWQVAWADNEPAGMVLAHYDPKNNPKHGYTEHIFVYPKWRNRGLASALIVKSLHTLHAHGVEKAELGVDAQNENAAFSLYKKLGYTTISIDTWFRKPLNQ